MQPLWRLPTTRTHQLAGSAGPLTFVGGAADLDAHGKIRSPDNLPAQIAGALENVSQALAGENCTLDDVVRLKAYYSEDLEDWAVITALADHFSADPMPVFSTVPEPLQPFAGQLVQLQVIAQRNWRTQLKFISVERPVPEEWQAKLGSRKVTGGLRAGEFIAVANRTAAGAGDAVAQSHAVMELHEQTLSALGAGLQDSVKMEGHFFGTTREDWAPLALARASHFAEPGPPATVVPCQRLYPEGAVTKIDVMAMRQKRLSYDKYIPRTDIWPDRVWDWPLNLPYRQAIGLRDMIWLGGQVPSEPFANSGNRMMAGQLEGQTRLTMSYIEDLLRGFGRSPSDLKLMVCYFTCSDGEAGAVRMLDLLADCVGGPLPPLTLVPKSMMHSVENTVEIWGVAQG
ncbi:MAG: RidA family protein [Pseudomonadota bacterium]